MMDRELELRRLSAEAALEFAIIQLFAPSLIGLVSCTTRKEIQQYKQKIVNYIKSINNHRKKWKKRMEKYK